MRSVQQQIWWPAAAVASLLLVSLPGWAEGPKTAEGKPDFSGTYNIATVSPL